MDLLIALARFTPSMVAIVGEDYLRAYVAAAPELSSSLLGKVLTGTTAEGIPRAYGLVVLSNVIASGVALLVLGGRVGKARKELDVPLPFLYAEPSHKHAVKFNSIQRGHAQALETYPIFLANSLIAGLYYPLFTASMGALWVAARFAWADGYATGNPDNRYTYSRLGRHVWTPIVTLTLVNLKVAFSMLAL